MASGKLSPGVGCADDMMDSMTAAGEIAVTSDRVPALPDALPSCRFERVPDTPGDGLWLDRGADFGLCESGCSASSSRPSGHGSEADSVSSLPDGGDGAAPSGHGEEVDSWERGALEESIADAIGGPPARSCDLTRVAGTSGHGDSVSGARVSRQDSIAGCGGGGRPSSGLVHAGGRPRTIPSEPRVPEVGSRLLDSAGGESEDAGVSDGDRRVEALPDSCCLSEGLVLGAGRSAGSTGCGGFKHGTARGRQARGEADEQGFFCPRPLGERAFGWVQSGSQKPTFRSQSDGVVSEAGRFAVLAGCEGLDIDGDGEDGSEENGAGREAARGDAVADESPTWRRRRRRKLHGSVVAHALFLQHVFRRTRLVRPGCWRRGGLCFLAVYRPPTIFACKGGRELAPESRFAEQRTLARQATAWYQNYVALLRRLRSGRTPTAVVGFCGQGGVSEGIRRANGASHGQDLRDQPRYRRWFGEATFSVGDSTDASRLKDLRRSTEAFLSFHSPPCKAHSTARMRGAPSEPALITQTRDAQREAGGLRVIENVPGARSVLDGHLCTLRGSFFGEHVDRPRLFEANFDLRVDEALRSTGEVLRRGTCLGFRRRWRRLDSFGRPVLIDCCRGNLWAVQGDRPLRCSEGECARALGLDEGHMDYVGMSQAVPPVYAQYIFGQACMREVSRVFGIEAITFDDLLSHPSRGRRLMSHWLRGAGGASPDQGVEFEAGAGAQRGSRMQQGSMSHTPARVPSVDPAGDAAALSGCFLHPSGGALPVYKPLHGDRSGDSVLPATELTVAESEWRELQYSWAGGYDAASARGGAFEAVSPVRTTVRLGARLTESELAGRNSLLVLGGEQATGLVGWFIEYC